MLADQFGEDEEIPTVEPEVSADPPDQLLFDSSWDYVTASLHLIGDKKRAGGGP
jgi:hypothetical protein